MTRICAHRNTSGNLSIRLRCLVGDVYRDIATGITVTPSDWDNRRQRVKSTHADAAQLNDRLNTMADRAADYLRNAGNATVDALRAAMEDIAPAADTYTRDDLFDALTAFIQSESQRNTWSAGTTKRFMSLHGSLAAFMPVMHLSTLTAATLDNYVAYRAGNGCTNTTIAKEVKLLRWFLRWCRDNGRYDGNLFDTYAPHLKGANYEYKEVIYLTLDELHAVEHAELPASLSNVRDVFVFCCYTGLRYSDVAALRRSDIHDGYIEVVTRKTDKRLRIELNNHAAAILARHAGKDYPRDAALPVISNQHTNDGLKAIGQLVGIDEPIHVVKYSGSRRIEATVPKYSLLSSHCARRTFVVTALQLGIPIEVITRWTGHSDLKALKPYVAIVDKLKAAQMSKFNDL